MPSIPPETQKLQDDEKLYLGDDDEFSLRKSGNQLIFRDENNSTDIPLLEIGNGNIITTFDVEGGEPVYFGDNNDVSMSYDEENDELVITDTEDEAILMSLPTGVSEEDVGSYTLDGIINDYFTRTVDFEDHTSSGNPHSNSASQDDLDDHSSDSSAHHERPSPGDGITEDEDGNWNADSGVTSHDELDNISEDDHRSDQNIVNTVSDNSTVSYPCAPWEEPPDWWNGRGDSYAVSVAVDENVTETFEANISEHVEEVTVETTQEQDGAITEIEYHDFNSWSTISSNPSNTGTNTYDVGGPVREWRFSFENNGSYNDDFEFHRIEPVIRVVKG